jgi:hypothetical protein
MKFLVVVPHYCGAVSGQISGTEYGSQMHVLPRVAALNEMLVALHRNFGPKRYAGPQRSRSPFMKNEATLDIVIVTMQGRNVLDLIGIDATEYQVEYFDGDPLMLSFETQRIARERLGAYDLYAMMEDDLIIYDPAFLEKIVWFQSKFGPDAVLQPQRIEASKGGRLAKSLIDPEFSQTWPEFVHCDEPDIIAADYHGRELTFQQASNPHSGCWFLTAEQMQEWVRTDYFYDRLPAWCGPLESAATRALAKRFAVYRASAPDPFFLELEHYGVRFANTHAPANVEFHNSPMLRAATQAARGSGSNLPATAVQPAPSSSKFLDIYEELTALRAEKTTMSKVFNSRSKMTGRIAKLMFTKLF